MKKKKKPSNEKLLSLYPLSFDEALKAMAEIKPKEKKKKKGS